MSHEPFSLDELIPEPLTVTFGGMVYEVKTTVHFGPLELATFQRLERRVQAATTQIMSTDDAKAEAAAQVIAQVTDEMLLLLIPTLTAERAAQIAFGRKGAFLTWWREQQPEPPPSPKAAGRRSPPTQPKRSRASSTPGTTRSRS